MRLGLTYFRIRSYDVRHVAIVEFVPVIMSYNGFPINQFIAGWFGLFSKYLVVTSLMRCSRSFVYSRFVRLSRKVSFLICHLFSAKKITLRHRFVAQVCDVWCLLGSLMITLEEISVYHLSCASFHWEEMRPTKKLVHPISHWSLNAHLIVSWIGSVVVQSSVGVVPVRNDRIDWMRIVALISGWVFLVVRYFSSELVSRTTWEYPGWWTHVTR